MYIESVMPSNHLILCHPLLLLPSIFSSIRVFSSESALHIRWPKYWRFSFSFSIGPSDEYSGLISFRIDWFHLLAVQGTLKSLLQPLPGSHSVLTEVCPTPQQHHCSLPHTPSGFKAVSSTPRCLWEHLPNECHWPLGRRPDRHNCLLLLTHK